jgi:hypothetical protein
MEIDEYEEGWVDGVQLVWFIIVCCLGIGLTALFLLFKANWV